MTPTDDPNFYHGTRAHLNPGDFIGPGYSGHYGQRRQANFVYFSTTLDATTWGRAE